MRRAACVIALVISGCASSADKWANETVTVAPQGAVPVECKALPAVPVPTPGDKNADETLNEYIDLQGYTLQQRRAYRICQKWAQAQR